jgi:hypothetical protein
MRNVPDKICKANKNTFYAQKFFSENRAVYDILWYSRTGHTWQYDAAQKTRALHAGQL